MLLRIEALGLIGLAIGLAGPIPAALARARWPARDPRAALVAWQAVGLGGGLSMLGAGVTLAAAGLDRRWLGGLSALPTRWSHLGILGWIGVALSTTIGLWLILVTVASTTRIVLARRTHRRRLDAIAELPGHCPDCSVTAETPGGAGLDPLSLRAGSDLEWSASLRSPPRSGCLPDLLERHPDDLASVRVVDHPVAVAYCLPGIRPRIVVSRGVLKTLDSEELLAVLAHERAHARGRHDLVIQPFIAWQATFPFLPTARAALSSVELLVEMLADDAASRRCPPSHLQAALALLTSEQLAVTNRDDRPLAAQLAARSARLETPPRPLRRLVRSLIYVAAGVLIVLPAAVLLLS